MRVSIIVAVAENGVIGRRGKLPWRLSSDLKRFQRLTMGHTIIMGRRTWESIGRPLPGRRMIVVTRRADYASGTPAVKVVRSLESALRTAEAAGDSEAFVIGGAELYREALPRADRLYLTRVRADVPGETVLPEVPWAGWRLTETTAHGADDSNDFPSVFEVYERSALPADKGQTA
jgi:dihydrofolate reductase